MPGGLHGPRLSVPHSSAARRGRVGAGIGAVISVASSGLAAYFARRIVVPENAPEELDILHIDGFSPNMRIHLPADEETTVPGTYGLYFNQAPDTR